MKRFLAGEMLARAGARLGITVELEPEFRYVGRIVLPDGRKHYFRNTNFDLNGQGAVEIARDKAYAAFFLARMGYPVPEGRTFFAPAMQRWSGATRGLCIGHVGPEAAVGGPIGLVQDGDIISIDAHTGTIELEVDADELARRRAEWKPRKTNYNSGAIWKFAQLVGPAHLGAVTHPGAAEETHVYMDL